MDEVQQKQLSINDLPAQSELVYVLEKEAKAKNLQVFIFRDDELKQYHTPATTEIGVALLAKNKDNAIINLQKLKRCYLIRLDK